MSDAVLISIVAGVPATIAALIGLRNSGKLVQIHTLTNDSLSRVTAALAVANERINGLEKAEALAKAAKKP